MKKCKYCQSEIDVKAKICPHCQKKQSKSKLPIILLVMFVLIIAVAVNNSDDNAKEGEISNSNSSENVDSKKEKFTYEITNQYADSAGFAYYIEGNVKNNRNKNYSYVQIEFICYDSNGVNLGTAIDNTNNLLGNQTWKYKAMGMFSGAENVDHCDYHEITGY